MNRKDSGGRWGFRQPDVRSGDGGGAAYQVRYPSHYTVTKSNEFYGILFSLKWGKKMMTIYHLSYLVCFVAAYKGPNAGVLGNVGNSYWHYQVSTLFPLHSSTIYLDIVRLWTTSWAPCRIFLSLSLLISSESSSPLDSATRWLGSTSSRRSAIFRRSMDWCSLFRRFQLSKDHGQYIFVYSSGLPQKHINDSHAPKS